MIEEKKQSLHEASVLLCEVYNFLLNQGEVVFPLLDSQIESIDSITKTVYANYFGFERFPTNEDKATAFFCLIIKDHPVTDGNKRMAVMWLAIFCAVTDLIINPKIYLDVLAVSIENMKDMTNDELFASVKELLF